MTDQAEKTQATLAGELLRNERGPVATALLTFTGILPVGALLELFGRVALKYRRTAKASYDGHAFVLLTETQLLGKTVRKERWFAGADVLLRREESYPQLALYTGLFALLAGSYWGIRLVWDGVRSASFSVIGLGLLFLLLGLGLDYALSNFLPKGRVRFCVAFSNVKQTARIGVATAAEADAFVAAVLKPSGTATVHAIEATAAAPIPPADVPESAVEAPKAQSESLEEAPATAHPEAP